MYTRVCKRRRREKKKGKQSKTRIEKFIFISEQVCSACAALQLSPVEVDYHLGLNVFIPISFKRSSSLASAERSEPAIYEQTPSVAFRFDAAGCRAGYSGSNAFRMAPSAIIGARS